MRINVNFGFNVEIEREQPFDVSETSSDAERQIGFQPNEERS